MDNNIIEKFKNSTNLFDRLDMIFEMLIKVDDFQRRQWKKELSNKGYLNEEIKRIMGNDYISE